MKKSILFLVIALFSVSLVAQSRQVFGTITDGKIPLKDVKITNLEDDLVVVTDESGKYTIEVETGDRVRFSHVGFKTITIKIEDVTRVLNPIMFLEVTELDEVVVTKNNRESQSELLKNFATDRRIVRTSKGFMNTDWAIGFVRVIGKEEISPADNCILGLLKNRSAEVWVEGSCFGEVFLNDTALALSSGYVYIKSNSFSAYGPAVFDVDGELFLSAPTFLDVTTIERIAILDDRAARIIYGPQGISASGVIVINTIDGLKNSPGTYDYARLTDNYVTGKVLKQDEVNKNRPDYIEELETSTSFEEAKNIYLSRLNQYSSSPYFLIDAYKYFYNKWNNSLYADQIIDSNFKIFEKNSVLLKALAYTYEEQNRFKKANELYKEVFILRPNYAQSYMDMANSYRNIKENKQAASIYARYEYLLKEDFMQVNTVFGPIINREFNNLLMLNKESLVDRGKAEKLFVADEEFEGKRLVFEWNDNEAEFDLQFVNPGNQYHTWNHSWVDNSEVIDREKQFGYNVTEYLIDGSLPGTWKVNVNYLGNKSLSPTYLKATVYHNYGSKSQRKEVKVFKLSLKNVNHELFKLQSSATVVAN